MQKIIIIEKITPSSMFWKNLVASKRIAELSVEEVIDKYEGFQGELVGFFQNTDNESELRKILGHYFELKKSSDCLMLHVISGEDNFHSTLKEKAIPLGYDIGVCEEEKTIFSSIFNEVLFGFLDELVLFKDLLNEHLLFPEKHLAEKYLDLHNVLSAEGKGVEDYEEMFVYEIWKYVGNDRVN